MNKMGMSGLGDPDDVVTQGKTTTTEAPTDRGYDSAPRATAIPRAPMTVFQQPFESSATTEAIKIFSDSANEFINKSMVNTGQYEVRVMSLNESDWSFLNTSGLIFSIHLTAPEHAKKYFYLTIAFESALKPGALTIEKRHDEREVLTPEQACLNRPWLNAAADQLRATIGAGDVVFTPVANIMLSKEFDFKNPDTVYRMLRTLMNQLYSTMMMAIGGRTGEVKDWTLDMVSKKDSLYMVGDTERLADGQLVREDGLPVRTDVYVTLNAQSRSNNDEFRDGPTTATNPLISVGAYVDLIYINSGTGGYDPFRRRNQFSHIYRPVIHISSVEFHRSTTPNISLMALASSGVLAHRQGAAQIMLSRQNMKLRGIPVGNVGALNYDAHLVETEPGQFGNFKEGVYRDFSTFGYFLDAVLDLDDTRVALDVFLGGIDNWWQSMYLGLVSSDPNEVEAAERSITRAADSLTNGAFSSFLPKDRRGPFAEMTTSPNYFGTYIADGEQRDLRDQDQLAYLNIWGVSDPEVPMRWSNAALFGSNGPADCMAERRAILTHVTDQKLHIIGEMVAVEFSNENFINPLLAAIESCGLVIQPPEMLTGSQSQRRLTGAINDASIAGDRLFSTGPGVGVRGSSAGIRNIACPWL